jgi:hypothetical protein
VTAINQRLAECVPFLDGAIHRTEGTNRDALVHLKELLFGMRL